MTEIKRDEQMITNPEPVVRTEIVPFITVPARTQQGEVTHTFKEATKEEISNFIERQVSLDMEGKQALEKRLLRIQERLNTNNSSKDEGRGI